MRYRKTKNGLKKVNFFGVTIARLEFGKFRVKDTTYNARITDSNSTWHFTDATHGLIEFTDTAKQIFNWKPSS